MIPLGETPCGEMPAAGPVWRCLVGPNLSPRVYRRLEAQVCRGLIVERNRSDFPTLLSRAALSVSQAGYNTVFEGLSAGCRVLLVPYVERGETEQTRRAELLCARGMVSVITAAELSAERLNEAVNRALSDPPPHRPGIE